MKTPIKLAAFAGVLALSFGGALGVGAAVGGPAAGAQDAATSTVHGAGAHAAGDAAVAAGAEGGVEVPGGLMVSQDGYTLQLAQAGLPAGAQTPLAFRILGADGAAVTSYEQSHDEDMHVIAVRRDTTGFQHVHPELGPDGTWSVPVDLTPGTWRVFTDFVPGAGAAAGDALTLGADLAVAGDYQPAPLPAPSATAQVDGYTVTLDGQLVPGQESGLTLSVSRDGRPVTDLQPYLGAYGHLVALRDGDLAYLHVHPAGEPDDGTTRPGPDITFHATAPSPGTYRLFLDFRHGEVVRTAEFTVRAGAEQPAEDTDQGADQGSDHADDGHGHG